MTKMLYTPQHEWLSIEEDIATVGITDHAQEQLGDVVFVELPEVGASISKDDCVVVIESVKAAGEILSAVSGTVLEVNELLTEEPDTVNGDPYDAGWMFKIKVDNPEELEGFMDKNAYDALLDE